MKSLFSCFPKRKSKSKTRETKNNSPTLILESKEQVLNHSTEEPISKDTHLKDNITIDQIDEQLIEKNKSSKVEHVEEPNISLFNERLTSASSRIENVYDVLHDKKKMYCLLDVIFEYKHLVDSELSDYMTQSSLLGGYFVDQSLFVSDLFSLQLELLLIIQNQEYSKIDQFHSKFQIIVVQLNRFCSKEDENFVLNRFLADSLMIFGWICCFKNPSSFVQNVLDGTTMTAARLVNDSKCASYQEWLKSWSRVLRAFSGIISRHFEAALMWRMAGPVPMEALRCLLQSNYSNVQEQPLRIAPSKPKVVKTTAAGDISYETVTNLFDDLRSGKQRSKLRSVKKDEPEVLEISKVEVELVQEAVEAVPSQPMPDDRGDDRPYSFQNNTWIIKQKADLADIEIPNSGPGNSVLISDCQNCTVQVDGILRDLTIDKCSAVTIIVEDIAGVLSATDSVTLETQVLGTVSLVTLTRVGDCRLFLGQSAAASLLLETRQCAQVDLYVARSPEGGLDLEDYERHSLVGRCVSVLVDAGGRPRLAHTIM